MTIIQFLPSPISAFQFIAELDGNNYNCIVTWNVYGQRWYITVANQDGTPVFTLPQIGSPNNYDISLTAGYFTSTMVFRQSLQRYEINP